MICRISLNGVISNDTYLQLFIMARLSMTIEPCAKTIL